MNRRLTRTVMASATMMSLMSLMLATGIAAPASAQVLNEATLHVRLYTPDPESGGYAVRIAAEVRELASRQDRLRIDVKQGARTVVSQVCAPNELSPNMGRFECTTGDSGLITTTGAVTIEIQYMNDVAETTTLLRSMSVNVRGYPYWVHDDDRGRPVIGTTYQIDAGSLVGTAFAYMLQNDDQRYLQLFTAFSGTYEGFDSTLRCRVGDERIRDVEVSTSAFAEVEVEEWTSQQATRRRVAWYRARLEMNALWWGPHVEGASAGWSGEPVFLGDHPGLWSCDMRSDGAVLRTFRFMVDAQGSIVAHSLEAAAGTPRMIERLHVVDVRFPATNPRDAFFEPASIRASFQYGTPWADPTAVSEMLGALPPANGTSAPTARAGAARGGRQARR